jgi:hypothetical protein
MIYVVIGGIAFQIDFTYGIQEFELNSELTK